MRRGAEPGRVPAAERAADAVDAAGADRVVDADLLDPDHPEDRDEAGADPVGAAQDATAPGPLLTLDEAGQAGDFGLGVMAGSPTGLTAATHPREVVRHLAC